MPTCCVKCCRRNSIYDKKSQGITFHRFPTENSNSVWRNDWVRIIRECRQENNWNPSNTSVVCSVHFENNDLYTTKGGLVRVVEFAVPRKFLWESPPCKEKQDDHDSLLKDSTPTEMVTAERKVTPLTAISTVNLTSMLSQTDSTPTEFFTVATEVSPSTTIKNEDPLSTLSQNGSTATETMTRPINLEQPLSLLFTPRERRLQEKLEKKHMHIMIQKRKIKTLNEKVRRLQNRNATLIKILHNLKNEKKKVNT